MIGAGLVIGFARAIVIIAENAQIIDTILFGLSSFIGKLPSLLAACVMLPVQMFINFFVISGSGQELLTMPILAPLGDLLEISRTNNSINIPIRRWVLKCYFPNIRSINGMFRNGWSTIFKMVQVDNAITNYLICTRYYIHNLCYDDGLGVRS